MNSRTCSRSSATRPPQLPTTRTDRQKPPEAQDKHPRAAAQTARPTSCSRIKGGGAPLTLHMHTLTHGHGHAPPLRARRASRPTRRLRADTDDASVEQLALMREEVDRPNLVSDWPAAPHPRSTVHDAVLRNRRARHPDERHAVHPVACELTRRRQCQTPPVRSQDEAPSLQHVTRPEDSPPEPPPKQSPRAQGERARQWTTSQYCPNTRARGAVKEANRSEMGVV